MEKFEYFSEIFGLVTEADPGTENGGLFLAHYIADKPTWKALQIFNLKMKNARLPNGMYRRSANHNKRSVSNDELTGMLASSYALKTTHRFEIWEQLKANFGAYPSVVEHWSDYLPFNLANYYAWGQYAESKLSYLFLPFYIINLIETLSGRKEDTSSKLIYNTELRTLPNTFINNLIKKYVDNRLKKVYGDNFIFEMRKIYFNKEKDEFPLFRVVKA
jgi:hypothetical protein